MPVPIEFSHGFSRFPPVLQALVEAELAAGNAIVEISPGFPAPPVGLCLKLARNLMSRPRTPGDGLDYYARNHPGYSGEITDAKRYFFLLEPPEPPQPEPDMDAIRAALEARYRASMSSMDEPAVSLPSIPHAAAWAPPRHSPSGSSSAVEQFRASMEIDYDRWREGTSYAVDILKSCSPAEQAGIEELLTGGPAQDWRDVEALAALGTPRAHKRLREVLRSDHHRLRMAVLDYAPALVTDQEKTAALIAALEHCDPFTGLSQALHQLEEFHPPEIIAALLRITRDGPGDRAVHLAAMLLYLHGKAGSPFDWEHRPFLLRFNTADPAEREAAFRDLCRVIGMQPLSGQDVGPLSGA